MLKQQTAISNIIEGMEVFDVDGQRIGTVKAYRQGEGTIQTAKADSVSIVMAINSALKTKKQLTTALYSRLYGEGFISVQRGFLKGEALVFPNQIAEINGNRINLNIGRSHLVKL